nr:gamma-glutamyl-gamma-aminobutyrate hydrolase [Pantoea sp. 201603H]
MGIALNKPLIGIVMCQIDKDGHPTQMVHNKYLDAVVNAGGIPLALPHMLISDAALTGNPLASLDGVLLTGSTTNIEPHHYGERGTELHTDPGRDKLAFAIITQAMAYQMPLMAICRGLQELVVVTGGSLYRQVHLQPGLSDHREDTARSLEEQYAPAHSVSIEAGGLLSGLVNGRDNFQVNSLHQQGVRSLGPGARIEARAADGLIEAVSLRHHPFALGVQWHPEWQSDKSEISRLLFEGFIRASDDYRRGNH